MNPIVVNWAKFEARKAVKRELQVKGEKVAFISNRKIVEAADAYLQAHPELLEQAADKVRKSPSLRAMAQREEQRRLRSKSKRDAIKRDA
jgi:hypothetical protein